jgi:hypothetical protein
MKHYEVTCAWCAAKGKRTVVGCSPVEHSSGICPECSAELWQKAELKTAAEREARLQMERDEGRYRQHRKASREQSITINPDGSQGDVP